MHFGSGSIVSSRSAFTNTGSPRPSRPGQLDPAIADNIVGGVSPEYVAEMAHTTAWALLSHVHTVDDPSVVERVLTIVDREGVDVIAELWSRSAPDTLPGVLWRLYCLRSWVRAQRESIARLWRLGEPMVTSASVIAGVDSAPTEDDLVRTADSILRGAFRGDFAVALDRAAEFVSVVVLGLRVQAKRMTARAAVLEERAKDKLADARAAGSEFAGAGEFAGSGEFVGDGEFAGASEFAGATERAAALELRTKAAKSLHTATNLAQTAKDLHHGSQLWIRGRLE